MKSQTVKNHTPRRDEKELELCSTTFANPDIQKIIDEQGKNTKLNTKKITSDGVLKYEKELKGGKRDSVVTLMLKHTPYTRGMKMYHRIFIKVSHDYCQIARTMISEKNFSDVPKLFKDAVVLFRTTIKKIQKQAREEIKAERERLQQTLDERNILAKKLGVAKITRIDKDSKNNIDEIHGKLKNNYTFVVKRDYYAKGVKSEVKIEVKGKDVIKIARSYLP